MNFLPARRQESLIPLAILLVGCALRLYSMRHSYAINSDGMLYIQQAKACHYGLSDSLTACYPYLNSLFVYIAVAHKFFADWLTAAQAVSLFFSTITLIPLYLLLRRFLTFPAACCTLLVFAVNPIVIEISSRIIRDPSFWFFLTCGMYSFLAAEGEKRSIGLFLSCCFYLCAGLARFEAVVFIPATLFFLLFSSREERWGGIASFAAPMLVVAVLSLAAALLSGYDLKEWLYPRSLLRPIGMLVDQYHLLQQGLDEISAVHRGSIWDEHFFPTVSSLLWWLGLGSVLVEIVRTFFEPFFLLFLIGLPGVIRCCRREKRVRYLLVLAACSLLVLYIHELGHWTMRGRFVVFFLLSTFVIIGFGIEKLFCLFATSDTRKKMFYPTLALLIFVIPLQKNMDENRVNVKLFQEIGNHIARCETSRREVRVAAAFEEDDVMLITFFGNLPAEGASCVSALSEKVVPRELRDLEALHAKEISYLVWDEHHWQAEDLGRLTTEFQCRVLREWQDKRRGKVVLLAVDG